VSRVRPRLAFVSPVFLFPADTGGRIRTTNILRGLKGGEFDVTLLMPVGKRAQEEWAGSIATLCDQLVAWTPTPQRPRWRRAGDLLSPLPVNVVADRRPAALRAVADLLGSKAFDIVVFDFVHSAALRPANVNAATLCFTHNVEAEIFERHAAQARGFAMRRIWASQARKMRRFEADVLPKFTGVVAVSQRDAEALRARYGVSLLEVIPTGVDLDYFRWSPPRTDDGVPRVVFTGSMDWDANVDGISHFLMHIWPLIRLQLPKAQFVVVGRNPPSALLDKARTTSGVVFTGFVDDVRPHVYAADVFVIPLRVGGGTRIKAFEAMAMGRAVVSTSIGIEGLGLEADQHFLQRDDAAGFADAVVALLRDLQARTALAERARAFVEEWFGHIAAAKAFERACQNALRASRGPATSDAPLSALNA
jgi:polysaccharide biosynthesis protein PslH